MSAKKSFHYFFIVILLLALLFAFMYFRNKNEQSSHTTEQVSSQVQTVEEKNTHDSSDSSNGNKDSFEEKVDARLENLAIQVPDMLEIYADGDRYLAWFEGRPNVQKTASGLLYRTINQGSGPMPARENRVQVEYRGMFPNGDVFDSSKRSGKPADFAVTEVIPGWTEMLLLMNEGSKVEVVIPPELAYGQRGAGDIIPPGQVLRFDIELLDADFKK